MASSYHLPHRGLPQELLDKIYAYALRPNEGLTIRCKGENQPYNSPQPEQDPNERAQCYIQGLAAGLLRTNWKTYCDTKHMLYSNTCVTIATRSIDAIDFIVELPLQIRSVIIPAEITLMCSPRAWIDDLDTYEDWSYYLKKKMPSAEVTIVVKDARARRSGDSPTDWYVVSSILVGLPEGCFSEVRLVFEGNFDSVPVYEFADIEARSRR